MRATMAKNIRRIPLLICPKYICPAPPKNKLNKTAKTVFLFLDNDGLGVVDVNAPDDEFFGVAGMGFMASGLDFSSFDDRLPVEFFFG